MARCGCNPTCSCKINGSACLTGTGIGTPTNPYSFDVAVDGETLVCGPNGLQRVLFTVDTNTVDIEGDGSLANPLEMHVIRTPTPQIPDPDALGFPNLIQELPGPGGGIYVSCEDVQDCVGAALADMLVGDCLVYDDVTNSMILRICAEPNGLECAAPGDPNCPTGGLLVFPSADPGNALTFGTDNRLFIPAFSVAAGNCLEPITQAGTPADPFIIAPQVAPELNGLECIPGQGLAVIPSADADNALTFGPDNRLFADICFNANPSQLVVGQPGPCIETTGNGCDVPFSIVTRLSDDPCQGICCRPDGLFVFSNPTPVPPHQGLFSENWTAGPFNGNFDDTVAMAPRCQVIVNPSQCRTMLGNIIFGGVIHLQKTSGNFVVQFQTSLTGPGGPWNTAVSAAALDPDPPTPQTVSQVFTVNGSVKQAFEIAPGANQQVCYRIVLDGFLLVNGRVQNSDRSAAVSAIWGQNVNTCP